MEVAMDVTPRDITPVTAPREAREAEPVEPVVETYNPNLRRWEPVLQAVTECPSEHCDVRVASDTPLEPCTCREAAPGYARRAEGSSDGGGAAARRPYPLPGERMDPLIGSARLQRVSAHPVGELTRLAALLASHERRIGELVADPARPRVALAAAQLWASLSTAGEDVLALLAAMDEADSAQRDLARALGELQAMVGEDGR